MKKIAIISAFILAATLTGCGSSNSSSSKTAATTTSSAASASTEYSTEVSSVVTTSKAETTEKATEITTEIPSEDNSEEYAWFSKGVYKVTVDGNAAGYYIFTDTQNGRTADGKMGIGVGFTCEQSKDSINFHKGSAYESEIMTMSNGENGTIVGKTDTHVWVFTLLEGVSADDFDAVEYEAQSSGQNPIMNFIGNYSNGRAMMNVQASGSKGAAVSISWGSSASATSTWKMSGECVINGDTITVSYTDCVRTDYVDDTEKVAYTDGTGSITFGSNVKWQPDNENYSDDNLTFTYVPVN